MIKSWQIFFLVLCFLYIRPTFAVAENIKVSVIHSYHKDYQHTVDQDIAFQKTLAKLLPNKKIEFSTVYLDTKWIEPSTEYKQRFIEYWKYKNKKNLPDYIYVTDDTALNFVLQINKSAPFNIPLVFSGVNDLNVNERINPNLVMGVHQKKDVENTLNLIETLNDNYRSVLFIGDGGVSDIPIKNEILKMPVLFPRLTIHTVEESHIEGLIKKINVINPDIIVVTTLGKLKHKNNERLSIDEIITTLTQSNKPLLSMDTNYFKKGVLGGAIASNSNQGEIAAKLLTHAINGKKFAEIIKSSSHSEMMIEYQTAEKFKIDINHPDFKNITLLNEPKAFYQELSFMTQVLWVIVIILMLVLLVVLFLQIRNRAIMKGRLIDKLSNLKNRTAFYENIPYKSDKRPYSIALIDICDFRSINDFYGLDIGDAIIQFTATSIKGFSNAYEAYRISGDVFALVAEDHISDDEFCLKIKALIQYLETLPFEVHNTSVNLTFVAGLSINEFGKGFLKASLALSKVKESLDDMCIYDDSLDNSSSRKANINVASTIKNALEKSQIIPFLQPIVCNKTKKVHKYEALARIVTDTEIIPPIAFLPIAKITKQYIKVTEAMLTKTVQIIIDHKISISINFSIEDINSETIMTHFKSLIVNREVAQRIGIEIVESERIENQRKVESFINEFKALGCQVLIDDFGTGYSNFTHILSINADIIKIDGSIIKNILEDHNSVIIVETIVALAAKLHMKTVGEFVENEEIYQKITDLGVDYSQGYFFGKPCAIEDTLLDIELV